MKNACNRFGTRLPLSALLALAALPGLLAKAPPSAAAIAPANTSPPTIAGLPRVGETITVSPGTWTGDHPLTFAYKYQVCASGGSSCTLASGLFANGPRPTFLLQSGTAGKLIKVIVTATNPAGKKTATTQLIGPVAAYPANLAPLVEFVNGLPEAVSQSNRSTFQFVPTGSGVSLTCQLDQKAPTTCPSSKKVTYGSLAAGPHTVTVTAKNAYGTKTISHGWTVAALPAPLACPGCYHPKVGTTWQWQLNFDAGKTTIDTSVAADMFDIDGYTNPPEIVSQLRSKGKGTTCYITAGTLENWRPDSENLDPQILGNPYSGFVDERWIDIRQIAKLDPWLQAKIDMCQAKGFDAIEFDNIDGWSTANGTGLNITAEDEIAFIVYLANSAHRRGMSMAMKSDVEQIPAVLDYVDFAVVEECFAYNECTRAQTGEAFGYDLFINAGKPVFEVEYKTYSATNNVCAQANSYRFSTAYKHVDLDSYRVPCWK